MKTLYKITILSILLAVPAALNAQVLISLLFGDALNSEKIEFGLIGGMNRSYILDMEDAEAKNNFDLGFYFHILMKEHSYLSTGVLVKSNVGAQGMPTYPVGDPDFDAVYEDGTMTKKINCFYVPILFHQRLYTRWYIEAGPQLGLIYKPVDIFTIEDFGGDLQYVRDVRDEYKHIDAGLVGGVGFKLNKAQKSTSIGIKYYYGLVNVSEDPEMVIKNSAIYFHVKIPIGMEKETVE